MFIPKLNSGSVFKYPFDSDKNLPLAECFERNKIAHFFCLFSYCIFNFYQCFANQLLEGTVVLMYMILNLKLVKITYKYFVMFSFQIFCAKNFSANCPLRTVELNQTK